MKKITILSAILVSGFVHAAPTLLYYKSDPGDWIGAGQERLFTSDDLSFTISRNYDNGVNLWMSGSGNWWNAEFAAPYNVPLQVGAYENATRFPFQAISVPGLNFSGNGRGSNRLCGRFEVKEIVYGPGGSVTSFAVDFEQHSECSTRALYGSIRYNSNVPISTLVPAKIGLLDALNSDGCVEATGPEGAKIHLFANDPIEGSLTRTYHWATSLGDVGSGETFEFGLGLGEIAIASLTVEDTATGESATVTKTLCVSDTTAPDITILSPEYGDAFTGNNLSLEVKITDVVDQNISDYTVTVGNSHSVALDPGSDSSKVKLFKPDPTSGPVPADVTVTTEDFSGNVSSSTVQVMIKHDNRKK